MHRTSTSTIAILCALGLTAGCATRKEQLLPHGNATMLDIWNQNASGSSKLGRASRHLLDARQTLRRPLTEGDARNTHDANSAYTRNAVNEIHRQFLRLPNPDLVMYLFPHLAGAEQTPVPGYSTVFPFYQRVQYAMPGERTEDY